MNTFIQYQEQILEEWKKDCQIDNMELDTSSCETPKLHAKYVELLSMSKLQKHRKEMEFKKLLKDIFYSLEIDLLCF